MFFWLGEYSLIQAPKYQIVYFPLANIVIFQACKDYKVKHFQNNIFILYI